MHIRSKKNQLQNFSKWMQLLNRLIVPIVTISLVSDVFTLVTRNGYTAIVSFVTNLYIILWLITFLFEGALHLLKQ